MFTQNIKEIPHNRSPQGRERLTANGYRFVGVSFSIVKDKPEQDIVSLPTPSTALLNNNTLITFEQVVKYLIRLYFPQGLLFGKSYH